MLNILITASALLIGSVAWFAYHIQKRNILLWLPAYVRGNWAGSLEKRIKCENRPLHVIFCFADHFEPALGDADIQTQCRRVDHWLREYPRIAKQFRDADGCPPRHTFFFPAEQYKHEHLARLAELVQAGYGEVEIHLHHHNDTSHALNEKLYKFKNQLRNHGHLGADRRDGTAKFGFIHGNWALDNSHPMGVWCGVNDELRVLRDCGCYADFTLPSAPSPTQTRRINSIYYATDDPKRPKSHDDGLQVRVGETPRGDLMIIQGPLSLTWPGGKFGIFPIVDAGNLAAESPPSPQRAVTWVNTRVCVAGRPDWIFVKVHTHGCAERNWPALFGAPLISLQRKLCEHYNDGAKFKLHYVTAREMYNIIKAAERGMSDDPGAYRDLDIAPPAAASVI